MRKSATAVEWPKGDELKRAVDAFNDDWQMVDEAIYRVCDANPRHDDRRRAVMAKMILINSAYSAGLERQVKSPEGEQVATKIGNCLWAYGSDVDAAIDRVRGIEEPLTPDDMKAIVREHGLLTSLLAKELTNGRSPRSFVSKYLHFHHPVVPIYDSKCWSSLMWRVKRIGSAIPFESPAGADAEYYSFCVRFLRIYAEYQDRGVEASVKDLDALLWQTPAMPVT